MIGSVPTARAVYLLFLCPRKCILSLNILFHAQGIWKMQFWRVPEHHSFCEEPTLEKVSQACRQGGGRRLSSVGRWRGTGLSLTAYWAGHVLSNCSFIFSRNISMAKTFSKMYRHSICNSSHHAWNWKVLVHSNQSVGLPEWCWNGSVSRSTIVCVCLFVATFLGKGEGQGV